MYVATTTDQLKDFYQNYRDSLDRQYQSNLQNLGQQRKNAQATIMSSANKAGMMYSNFPERSKVQYDTQTYEPAVVKLNTSYRTGLDTLRENVLNFQNSIEEYKKAIADLNAS